MNETQLLMCAFCGKRYDEHHVCPALEGFVARQQGDIFIATKQKKENTMAICSQCKDHASPVIDEDDQYVSDCCCAPLIGELSEFDLDEAVREQKLNG